MAETDSTDTPSDGVSRRRSDFIRDIVAKDVAAGLARVVTRFPPEPNGFLHIGHAKAILLDHDVAREHGGHFHLRFDDTNPLAEDTRFVEAIQADITWLGCTWDGPVRFASDYFAQMYELAERLVQDGRAYVDSESIDEIREHRGTVSEAGTASRYRDRSVDENLDLFRRMRAGEFADGTHVLRAKLDMASPNMLLRDPLLYRIRHATHHRTGDAWCIYPMYDFAHCIEDAIEGVTHSFCTLEFEINRALYDWVLESVWPEPRPRQFEFARLELDYVLMSKRYMRRLVEEGHVSGWDDPRMSTLRGLRRRGVTSEALRALNSLVGISKANSVIDLGKLEYCVREDLNLRSPRLMCVLHPLRVVLTNLPEDHDERIEAPLWPHDVPHEGSRALHLTREIWIERDDFRVDPPKGWHRLTPGGEVRLRHGYVIRCDDVVLDGAGEIVELRCSADRDTLGSAPTDRRVRGTIHWVSAVHGRSLELRLYDRLFAVARPGRDPEVDFVDELNPESLTVIPAAMAEPELADARPGDRFQLERVGYFIADTEDSRPGSPVLNRTVTLRDSWGKRDAPKPAARVRRPKTKPAPAAARVWEAGDPDLADRFDRYTGVLGLDPQDAHTLTRSAAIADYFDAAASAADTSAVAKWVVNEVLPAVDGDDPSTLGMAPTVLAAIVTMVTSDRISATAAKEVFAAVATDGADPEAIVRQRHLEQVSDTGTLGPAVDGVLAAHPDEVARYRGGKTGLLGFFVGRVMKETRGTAKPDLVRRLVVERLGRESGQGTGEG